MSESEDHRFEKREFQSADIIVFSSTLSFCAIICIAKGCTEMRQRRKEGVKSGNLAMGGRPVWTMWQAAQSFLHGAVALPFMLGIPGEVYCFGVTFLIIVLGYAVGSPFFIHFILVRLQRLKITNIYQYFSLRFNPWVHRMVSVVFTIMSFLFIGTIVYAQGLIFAQLTGLSLSTSILIVRLVGIGFTGVASVKGIVWLDVFHLLVIVMGIIFITLLGSVEVGGFTQVIQISEAGLRTGNNIWDLEPALARHSFWSQLIGGAVLIMIIFSNQLISAKYLGHESTTRMFITSYVSVFFSILKMVLFGFVGIVCYAYYYGCDPVTLGKVDLPDQLLPALMLDTMAHIPGFAGFIFGSILTASLGTITASLNTLSAICLMDFIEPLYKYKTGREYLNPCLGVLSFKLCVLAGNVITLAVPYLGPIMKATLSQMTIINLTIAGGPILGLFILGIFVPFANSWGAFAGMGVSVVWNAWIMTGGIVTQAYSNVDQFLDFNVSECLPNNTLSVNSTLLLTSSTRIPRTVTSIYDLSYMWIGTSSVLLTIIVGSITSVITGWKSLKTLTVDPDLCFPYGYPVKMRLGVEAKQDESIQSDANSKWTNNLNSFHGSSIDHMIREFDRRRHSLPAICQEVLIQEQREEDSLNFHKNLMVLADTGLVWINTEDLSTHL